MVLLCTCNREHAVGLSVPVGSHGVFSGSIIQTMYFLKPSSFPLCLCAVFPYALKRDSNLFICMCAHVWRCMYVSADAHACICICKSQLHVFIFWLSTLGFETVSLTGIKDSFVHLDWMVCESQGSSCLNLPSTRIASVCHHAWHFEWVLGIKFWSQACSSSTLLTESSPQPPYLHCN